MRYAKRRVGVERRHIILIQDRIMIGVITGRPLGRVMLQQEIRGVGEKIQRRPRITICFHAGNHHAVGHVAVVHIHPRIVRRGIRAELVEHPVKCVAVVEIGAAARVQQSSGEIISGCDIAR